MVDLACPALALGSFGSQYFGGAQAEKAKFEGEARQRAGGNSSRYGEQEVCPLSGVIVNVEETRVRDHKMGRNYRWVCCGLQVLARHRSRIHHVVSAPGLRLPHVSLAPSHHEICKYC